MKLITSPIVGESKIREAVSSDYETIIDLVRTALAIVVYPGQEHRYVNIVSIYPDYVVIKRDGRQYKYDYKLNDNNQIELGSPEEVITNHVPVREALSSDGAFIEAFESDTEKKGSRYKIVVVKAGVSGNKNYYSNAVLKEAAPLFNNVRVFVKSDQEHLTSNDKDFNKLIGRIVEAEFIENSGKDNGEIQAVLEVLSSAGDVSAKILEAYERDMTDLFGFSIDADAKVKVATVNRQRVREAKKFTRVRSLDLIIQPGAGGEIVQLLEAQQSENIDGDEDMKLRDLMLKTIREANGGNLPDGLDENNDEQLEAAFREAVASSVSNDNKDKTVDDNGLSETQVKEALNSAVQLVEARSEMRVAVAESGLPEISQRRLRESLGNDEGLTTEKVTEAINQEKEYLAKITESGSVAGLGGDTIEPGKDRSEKVIEMFDGLFDPNNKDVISIKECYIEVTGDRRVTGQFSNCDMQIMREAFGGIFREAISASTFSEVLGDSIARAMLKDYALSSPYDIWRLIATVVPLNDFRTQERTRMGGYGDLPAVAENGTYGALTSPTDEKATYAATKRGGKETISLETIKNDDMGVVMRIPTKLSRAGKRTLSKFVLDFIRTNPTIYDSVALFHASHNNLGTSALDATSLAAGRLAMLQQTELDSGDRLGIPAKNLLVPSDLEETGFDLFRRQTNNESDFIESLQMNVVPVWYWTDANDWALTADKSDIPLVEVGFLDGQEEPELFVQDTPNQGSLFTNDQIVYKIRHIYGGNVMDYRGFYKAVVA